MFIKMVAECVTASIANRIPICFSDMHWEAHGRILLALAQQVFSPDQILMPCSRYSLQDGEAWPNWSWLLHLCSLSCREGIPWNSCSNGIRWIARRIRHPEPKYQLRISVDDIFHPGLVEDILAGYNRGFQKPNSCTELRSHEGSYFQGNVWCRSQE